jgi:hypothetical protein
MNINEIAKNIETSMIDMVAARLMEIMTLTDFGEAVRDGKRVFHSHYDFHLSADSYVPVVDLKGVDNYQGIRRGHDEDVVRAIAKNLLGISDS